MPLPTSAPLFAENTRLTLNRTLSEHLEKSIGIATLASVPGAISPTLIGSCPITLGWHVALPLALRQREDVDLSPVSTSGSKLLSVSFQTR